eukprot:scaffold113629_cov69-Attheya_sp.AAC.1
MQTRTHPDFEKVNKSGQNNFHGCGHEVCLFCRADEHDEHDGKRSELLSCKAPSELVSILPYLYSSAENKNTKESKDCKDCDTQH